MPLTTKGFESLQQLKRHFSEHGDDFRASNPNEYEQMADPICSSAATNQRECTNVYVVVEPGYAMIQAAKHTVY